jgi:NAD(P)-dependent dehydrogenase (short-subunit alcohol dehydrogenase family)/acyl carrier protein
VDPDQLREMRLRNSLFRMEWVAVEGGEGEPRRDHPAMVLGEWMLGETGWEHHQDLDELIASLATGAPPPSHVLVDCTALASTVAGDPATAARGLVTRAIALLQRWLSVEQLAESRLLFITRGAVAVDTEDVDPALSAIWGLVRSAASEHPGCFALLDVDASPPDLSRILPLTEREPQLAIRNGEVRAVRLKRVAASADDEPPAVEDAFGTEAGIVLVTGGTSGLGALIARHLAEARLTDHLALMSTSGAEAPEAAGIRADVEKHGVDVSFHSCDVSNRGEVEALLRSLSREGRLRGVIHAAGALDDGVLESMNPERVATVFRPKVDGAWNLHELTKGMDLSAFILFSSVAGVVGSPGQANYAAANTFLDALASHRRATGLPASSISWGLWREASAMLADLGEEKLERIKRAGFSELASDRVLELFDYVVSLPAPHLVAVELNRSVLRSLVSVDQLPPILRGIAPDLSSHPAQRDLLRRRLEDTPESEWEGVVLELVREQVALVLGYERGSAIDPQRTFKDLGLDSLGAVELRNRLNVLTGLRLPSTLIFNHPTTAGMAKAIIDRLEATGHSDRSAALGEELDALERLMEAIPPEDVEEQRWCAARLRSLLGRVTVDVHAIDGLTAEQIETADAAELISLLEKDLDGNGDGQAISAPGAEDVG